MTYLYMRTASIGSSKMVSRRVDGRNCGAAVRASLSSASLPESFLATTMTTMRTTTETSSRALMVTSTHVPSSSSSTSDAIWLSNSLMKRRLSAVRQEVTVVLRLYGIRYMYTAQYSSSSLEEAKTIAGPLTLKDHMSGMSPWHVVCRWSAGD